MKIRLKMVFAKDDLAVIVTCFTKKMDWYADWKRISKQEVIENVAEVEWLCQSQDIHCWCSHSSEQIEVAPLQHSLYRSPWHANDTCGLTLAVVSSWFIILWLSKLFNFSQIFVCHRSHGCSAAFLVFGSVRVTILPTDALVIRLLVWKFFCNPSTSPSFFSETCNNNRRIVFCKNHFQSNLQMRYLHNSILTWLYVIKRHSVMLLIVLLKFIRK